MSNRKTIYLDDAIDLVKYRMKHNPMKSAEFIQGLQDGYLRVLSDLERLPSAERKGKWIYQGCCTSSPTHQLYRCDCCGKNFPYKTNCCPNCGARMERSEWDGM